MRSFLEVLKERVLVFDGAMGTSIQNKGTGHIDFQGNECNEYINILQPEFIKDIHADFLIAGADVIETNTFGALPYLLKDYGLETQAVEINRAGARLALEAAFAYSTEEKPRFVSGKIGRAHV